MANYSLFIGYDPREDDAFNVAAHSAARRCHVKLDVHAIKLADLRANGLYTRPTEWRGNRLWDVISDAPMSTEFAISRFMTPHLSLTEWAVFCDCDFLWRDDIVKLFEQADPRKAVMCVQHAHNPAESLKMDNQAQLLYARKNWSSLMLWNCRHPANQKLTLEMINTLPGRDLHRFCWLEDHEIGALPLGWNWLEGHSDPAITPHAVHFTRGGPWFEHMQDVPYADEWRKELTAVKHGKP